ncbi:unnamed protein product [Sphagnum troendelagicum]|uniref:SPX domain-containing protein n=1 Tax=Sphagnum troendelagicum TaxID=128251 RepID=A0ABP0UEB5_9BRYO
MVRFGHYIVANQIPGWEEYYIGYKALKKKIRLYGNRASVATQDECQEIMKSFSDLLDSQIEKIVLFTIEKQGLLAGRLKRLWERRKVAQEMYEDDEDMESALCVEHFDIAIPHLMEDYRQVGVELLQLLQFVELNATGLRKILKKFDKRVGFRLGAQYIASRSNHPYSQLQLVFRQVGIGAMVATISRNLAELRAQSFEINSTSSSVSLFRSASLPRRFVEDEPIIRAIVEAMHRLTQEVSLVSYVAHELLLPAPKEEMPGMVSIQEDAHFLSIQINLINTFLYMVNYYIVVPSSDSYAELLNAPASLCGVIIGSMPLAALVSALVYSWWSNYSYQAPLIFSTLILMAGNLMYALALKFNSVWLLLIGRFLCGLGGARAINRRYISDHVPIKQLTSASAAFVSASALGMAVGPAIASLLSSVDFKFYGAPVNFVTAPGWIMTWLWGLYLVLVLLFFKEPRRSPSVVQPTVPRAASSETKLAEKLEDGSQSLMLTAQLLADSVPAQDTTDEEECEGDDSNCGDDRAVETVGELLKELTLPIRILLWIYFMLKFASEILISECSILTGYYFNWTTTQVGLFLGLLGLTVLPISAVVGNYISNIYEDRLVVLWSQIFTAVGVVAIFCFSPWLAYSPYQYIAAAILIFVSTNVLEGVNMSLLSKVMSPRLSRGVFNCGLLSTEAGTLARALADGLISVVGRGGQANLLNFTMIPTLSIVVYTTIYTWVGYYTLY